MTAPSARVPVPLCDVLGSQAGERGIIDFREMHEAKPYATSNANWKSGLQAGPGDGIIN